MKIEICINQGIRSRQTTKVTTAALTTTVSKARLLWFIVFLRSYPCWDYCWD